MEELKMEHLTEFMEKITILNKDIATYRDDEKGRMFEMNTISLLPKVERLELSSDEFKKAKFEMKVENLEYDIIEVDRPVPKNTITKKDEDIYTIVNSKVKVRLVWNVSNAIGVYKSFTNKDEAMEYAENIKKDIIKYFE